MTASVWASCLLGQVVVNEVMPVPPAGEPEWVELFNPSDSIVVLHNWWIGDLRSSVQLPLLALPPGGYALLTRDTAALREARPLPPTVLLAELRLPTLNNTSDAVVLRTPDSLLVDSLAYSMRWGKSGVSLERRLATLPAWSNENVLPCQSPAGATPGEVNSVTPVPYDLRLTQLRMDGVSEVVATVENVGTLEADTALCSIWIDADGDGSFTEEERRLRCQLLRIAPGEQQECRVGIDSLWQGLPAGWYVLQAAVWLPEDARRWNDTFRRRLYRSESQLAFRINEILYEPLPGGAEFVELVNVSSDSLSLEGWQLHDRSAEDTVVVSASFRVPPGGFAVIAWDSSLLSAFPHLRQYPYLYIASGSALSLANMGDLVVIRDPNGVLVDSVPYDPSWHDPAIGSARQGRSLEKLHPLLPSAVRASWSTCGVPAGATPGEPNSISLPLPSGGTLSASPNPFRLSSAERRYCIISYAVPFRSALVTVRLFTEDGALVRTLAHAVYSASQGYVTWDGRTDRGEMVPPGIYVLVAEAQETGGSGRQVAKSVLVVSY